LNSYSIDCRSVKSFDDFIAAVNAGFVQHLGGLWNGNLDAFNDYLYWDGDFQLELLGAENCAAQLGHPAQAAWLREHLQTCHPSNVPELQSRLARAEANEGETLFDVIKQIIASNPNVRLLLH